MSDLGQGRPEDLGWSPLGVRGGSLPAAPGARRLFPLHFEPEAEPVPAVKSSCGRRRARRRHRQHLNDLVREGVESLNWLDGKRDHPDCQPRSASSTAHPPTNKSHCGPTVGPPRSRPGDMNDAVVDHLRELAALYCPRGGPADYQPPEVALRELLRSPSGSYQSGGGGAPVWLPTDKDACRCQKLRSPCRTWASSAAIVAANIWQGTGSD